MADLVKSLGEFLRQERQKQGITLEQIASATKINIKTLHALEADHYQELPAKPFIRGFVISYARFIGLDPKTVISEFSAFIEEKQKERPNREGGHSGYAFEKREGEQTRTILWFIMGGFILLGGIVILFLKPSLHRHKEKNLEKLRANHSETGVISEPSPSPLIDASPKPASSPSAVVSTTATPTSTPVATTPSPKPTVAQTESAAVAPVTADDPRASIYVLAPKNEPSPAPSPSVSRKADPLNSGADLLVKEIKYKIIIKALDTVFVRYQCDDRKVTKFSLKKDKILVLRAKSTLKFQTSNPSVVTYNTNGRGEQVLADNPDLALRGKFMTLFIPTQLAKTIGDPFPSEPSKGSGSVTESPKTTPQVAPSP